MSKTVAIRKLINTELDESTATPRQKRVWALAGTGIGLDGYDLFIMSAALPLIQVYFGQTSAAWAGLLAGAAVLGAVPGALVSGVLADRFGRSTVLKVDIALFALTSVLCALAWNPLILVIFRFLQGAAIGAEYPISAAMVAEVMPRKNRGKWMTGAFSFQAVGMVAAASISTVILIVVDQDYAWRWMLLSTAIPAMIIAFMRRSIPESPRWLARKDRFDEARTSLAWLLGQDSLARIDKKIAKAANIDDTEPRQGRTAELFGHKMRSRTILATIPWFFMDISLYGIGLFTPAILATLFHSDATSTANAFLAADLKATASSAIGDLFLVIGFAINIMAVERAGRIKLQVLGFIGMAVGLVIVAAAGSGTEHAIALVCGFAFFNLMVNVGPNATTYLLPAEIYPTRLRTTGHGFAAACGKVGATIGVFLLPVTVASFGLGPTMAAIALMCLIGALVTRLFRVETRGIILES